MNIDIEICVNSEPEETLGKSITAAYRGGASRIELCSAMHLNGLTPSKTQVHLAREAFRDREGLLVMIRPRGGNFCYDTDTLELMDKQVDMAAEAGADGVVFGALQPESHDIDIQAIENLVKAAKSHSMGTTFHRAFDATPDRLQSLETLISFGIDRVLTSGNLWGMEGSALDGIESIEKLLKKAHNRIEIVIGGGVTPNNADRIINKLAPHSGRYSLHAYSGVREQNMTSKQRVQQLVDMTGI